VAVVVDKSWDARNGNGRRPWRLWAKQEANGLGQDERTQESAEKKVDTAVRKGWNTRGGKDSEEVGKKFLKKRESGDNKIKKPG